MGPEDILPTYERRAAGFAAHRSRDLFERDWLDRMWAAAPGRRVLDLGCGPGVPIATYLAGLGAEITGVDGAAAMVALFRRALPGHSVVQADMRALDLDRRFDAILAWNSFFHLSATDQRAMFAVFAAHAAPGAALMFTCGPDAGEATGQVEGDPVYHASLSPEDYEDGLASAGFRTLDWRPEDPGCAGHSVRLARFTGG
ncbi:MAG: class I SAM-dependent methyltransferase [Paracoccaceae bacterium]